MADVDFKDAVRKAVRSMAAGMRADAEQRWAFEVAEGLAQHAHVVVCQSRIEANQRKDGDWPHTRLAKWWSRRHWEKRMGLHAASAWFHEQAAKAYKVCADMPDPTEPETPDGSSH